MKKLYELFGKKPLEGDVGIEIECEGAKFKEVDTEVWRCEDDGSLRGRYPESRIEYILAKPIPVEMVKQAIIDLKTEIDGAKPVFSFRTSVHVHVNVLHLTDAQILSFIYTYLLLEEPLMNYAGKERKGNRFCLRLRDSGTMIDFLNDLFTKGVKAIKNYNEDNIRYAAMNLAPMGTYGSIEFRAMRGTLDEDVLDIWTKALVSIRNFACHQKDCLDVHDMYADMGVEGFINHVLGDLAPHFHYKKMVEDVCTSYSLSIDLPHTYQRAVLKAEKKVEETPKADFAPWALWDNLAAEAAGAIPRPRAPRARAVRIEVPAAPLAPEEIVEHIEEPNEERQEW